MEGESSLDSRLRKERVRSLLPGWKRALEEEAHIRLTDGDFLSIEETQELRTAFFGRVKATSSVVIPGERLRDVLEEMSNLANTLGDWPVILFSSEDTLLGAVRVPAGAVLQHPLDVWAVVKQDLSLTSEDVLHGLCLERNHMTPDGVHHDQPVYELSSWGTLALAKRD